MGQTLQEEYGRCTVARAQRISNNILPAGKTEETSVSDFNARPTMYQPTYLTQDQILEAVRAATGLKDIMSYVASPNVYVSIGKDPLQLVIHRHFREEGLGKGLVTQTELQDLIVAALAAADRQITTNPTIFVPAPDWRPTLESLRRRLC